MTDNPAPASLRSLGSGDDEPRIAAGSIPPGHEWVRHHVSLNEKNEITLSSECVNDSDPDTRDAIYDASRAAGHDPSTRIIGTVARRRTDPEGWGYSCTHQDPRVDGSRMYATALTAAYACAIQVADNRFERQRFDADQPLPVPLGDRDSGPSRSDQ